MEFSTFEVNKMSLTMKATEKGSWKTLFPGVTRPGCPLGDSCPSWSSRDMASQIISLAFCLPKPLIYKSKNKRK